MITYVGSLAQLCCGEGGTLQRNITGVCGECLQCMDHTGFAPAQGSMCFPGLHCSGSRLLCRALFKAGPAFRVLPRSKLLRFSDTPQGYRLGWACVLCPSQVRAAQATRCLASALSPGGAVWKLLLFYDSLPGMGLHPFLFCLSFYLVYFVLPPFEDNGLPFWVPDVLCQH